MKLTNFDKMRKNSATTSCVINNIFKNLLMAGESDFIKDGVIEGTD